MADNKGPYTVYDYSDKIAHGRSIHVEHSIHLNEGANIADITKHSLKELEAMREKSVAAENVEFEKLRAAFKPWEKLAAQTKQIDLAIEYVKTPVSKHTDNEWKQSEHGDYEISNMTYKMFYRIREDTKYDRELKESVPFAWDLYWSVYTNAPHHINSYPVNNIKIDGQEQKRFTDKAKMEKYLEGRKTAYAHFFIKKSPPVPLEYAKPFFVNGVLLPGYTLERENKAPERSAPEPERER